jgi:phage major head subunit gpT-like protein
MTTPINTGQWADALDPRIKIGVKTAFGEIPKEISKWFTEHETTLAEDNILSFGDFGAMEQFTGQVSFDTMKQEYKKTITHVEYAKGASIQRKLVTTNQLGIVDQISTNLGRSAQLRYVLSAYDWMNLATSSYTVGDGLSLANSSHTSNDSRGATQSNTATTELSFASFDAASIAMQKYITPSSNMDFENRPDTIVVPVDLESYATEIVGSKGKPDFSTNNMNFYYGSVDVVASRVISDTNNWAIVNKRRMKESQHWFTVEKLQTLKDQEISTLVRRWVLYCYYGYGSSDWRWIYYSNVS